MQTKKTRSHFCGVYLGEICGSLYTSWYRCLLLNVIFWHNFIEGFLFLIRSRKDCNKNRKDCKIFKNPLDKCFVFLKLSIVRNRFHKTREFQDTWPRLTLEKVANKWKVTKNGYLFDCLLPLQQSALLTHMNEKEIPGVLLIFTVNARSLNPKVKPIAHF